MDDYKDGFKRSFYSFDGHGSIRGLTNAEGTVYEEYDYDSYGIMIGFRQDEESGLESLDTQMFSVLSRNEFLFAGEQWDAKGFMNLRKERRLNKVVETMKDEWLRILSKERVGPVFSGVYDTQLDEID